MKTIPRQQGGYMLIAAALSILVFALLTVALLRMQARHAQITQDAGDGAQVAQWAAGLRGLVAAAQSDPGLLVSTPQLGTDWLKPPSCGGRASNPPEGYVPCSFNGGPLGRLFSTSMTHNPATNFIEARTVFVLPNGGRPREAIIRADRVAQAALANQATSGGVFFSAFANVPANAIAPVPPASMVAGDAGRVVLLATNAPSNDIFLRVDGTNQMLANLNMGGMSIGNARDARFSGSVRVEGQLQVDQGAKVKGPADLEGGVVTPEVALTGIGKFASEGIYSAQVYTGASSYTIPKPNCASAGNNPGIYVSMQSTGSPNAGGYSADAIYQARADVFDNGGSWLVQPVMYGTRFDMAMSGADLQFSKNVVASSPTDMRLVVMTRCR